LSPKWAKNRSRFNNNKLQNTESKNHFKFESELVVMVIGKGGEIGGEKYFKDIRASIK
jgi:uncharacterized protein YgbK (DUF1537 family)